MTFLKKFGFLTVFIFALASSAKASILIEPLVGYSMAAKVEVENYKTYSGGSGLSYGGRFGYQNLGFQLGVDYLKSTLDMDHKHFKNDFESSEFAGFIGYEFPILLKVYAGYIFSGQAESKGFVNPTTTLVQKADFNGGTGGKLGVGFTILPFLDINLEYRQLTYDEFNLGGVKRIEEVNYSAYLLSVSLPFNI